MVGTREQAELVAGYLDRVTFDDGDRASSAVFFAHLLQSAAQQRPNHPRAGWIPISARAIEQATGRRDTKSVWRPLRRAELVRFRRESRARRRSREFRPCPDAFAGYIAAGVVRPAAGRTERPVLYDLATGRPTRARPGHLYRTDSSGEPLPAAYLAALTVIQQHGCLFDDEGAYALVEQRRARWQADKASWEAGGRPEEDALAKALTTSFGRWWVDDYAFGWMTRSAEHVEGQVYRYTPVFARNPQSAGRATELGGLQGASREMKHAALAPLRASHDVRNYDMMSAQIWILVQLLEDAELDPSWLRAYAEGNKATYALEAFGEASAASVGVFKRALLALVMAGALPTNLERRRGPKGRLLPLSDVALMFIERFGAGSATPEAETALAGFRRVVGPFVEVRDAWHDTLVARVEGGDLRVGGRGGNFVRNAADATLNTQGLEAWPLKAKLSAHFLQGLEAAFIQQLTILGAEHGYRPMSQQHDGLVVVGPIPEAAVAEAREASGLRYASVREKRYHPDLPVLGLDESADEGLSRPDVPADP